MRLQEDPNRSNQARPSLIPISPYFSLHYYTPTSPLLYAYLSITIRLPLHYYTPTSPLLYAYLSITIRLPLYISIPLYNLYLYISFLSDYTMTGSFAVAGSQILPLPPILSDRSLVSSDMNA
jgi:hypothetical protein